ncbi:MAG: hypothetical protein KBS62_00135 [Oscillospiraceae bacterium]|nr:hypothetical protein [Candidatus Ruminococcus equi]
MNIYKIADLYISISPKYEYTKEILSEFLSDSEHFDFAIDTITDADIEYEKSVAEEPLSSGVAESLSILRKISTKLLESYSGFFFHCSCLEIDGSAVVFTGKSGVGKSTHSALWRKVFKDKVTMIDDDKPLIRKQSDGYCIYGTPWKGKHRIGTDKSAKIGAIFEIHQSNENRCEKKNAVSALSLLLSQTIMPENDVMLKSLTGLLSDMVENIPVYDLYCNISDDAVYTAYEKIKPI